MKGFFYLWGDEHEEEMAGRKDERKNFRWNEADCSYSGDLCHKLNTKEISQ